MADLAATLAPSGTLRAAINFGNPVLAQRGSGQSAPQGVSADLARELARRLDVKLDFVTFEEAGKVVAAAREGAWDVGFVAIDPVRGQGLAFTSPYVLIEGSYVVPATSRFATNEDVDREGVRIGVAEGSAYDLYLTRALRHATLSREANTATTFQSLAAGRIDVVAGVRQALGGIVAAHPEWRLVPGRFMAIEQAMAIPKDRQSGLAGLARFVEDAKASGLVANALARSGQTSAEVAPPAGR